MDGLQQATKAVGSKQVKKAILKGSAIKVYIAEDAENHVVKPLLELCSQNHVEVEFVESMEKLGKASGIAVGSAAVALLSD